jgi:serine protease Do
MSWIASFVILGVGAVFTGQETDKKPTSAAATTSTTSPAASPSPTPGSGTGSISEAIELRDGHQVVGEVIAEKPTALIIDLGFDVIRIPRDQVVRRGKPGVMVAAATNGEKASDEDPTGFFQTGRLKVRPVKELVEQYGESVISIETPSGKGSGFVINDQGYAMTNAHVIQGETKITAIAYVKSEGGLVRHRIENCEIIAINPFADLALIKLPPRKDLKLGHVLLGNYDEVNAGEGVFAVGNPLGFERSVSQGVLSNRSRNMEGQIYLQTDAAINPGNSGGPLFNMKGEVIGVTSLKITFSDNLGFAIPVNYVKDFLRNREAFAFNKDNPNAGYRYEDPPRRRKSGVPPEIAAVRSKSSSGSESKPAGSNGKSSGDASNR